MDIGATKPLLPDGGCFVNQLPDELFLKILDQLVWDGSDPYIPVGYDCPWTIYTKTRKAVTLVCQRWWMIGLSHLYSVIYIHRIGQLVALVNTLKASKAGRLQGGIFAHRPSEGYGPWVRCIYLHCYIPRRWHDVYRREVLEVLCLCPELRSFTNKPLWEDKVVHAPELSLFWTMQGHTTTLPIIYPESVSGRLSIFDKLTTLRIHIDIGTYNPSYNTSGFQQILVLGQLESLICDVDTYRAYENLGSISNWKLPKLWNLSFNFTWKDNPSDDNFDQAFKLFDAFGAQLRYFSLNNAICSTTCNKLLVVLTCCPKLEILAFARQKCKTINPGPSFIHNSLRRVEFVWDWMIRGEPTDHIKSFIDNATFPKMGAIVMQHPRFTDLPVTRAIYEMSYGYFSDLSYLTGLLQEAGISFLNRNEEPITISQEPSDDSDDSDDSSYYIDDLDDSDDSSYYTDELSDSTDSETGSEGEFETEDTETRSEGEFGMEDSETRSEGEFETEDSDGEMLTSEEALELYESMQYCDSEEDDLDEREEGDIANDMDVGD